MNVGYIGKANEKAKNRDRKKKKKTCLFALLLHSLNLCFPWMLWGEHTDEEQGLFLMQHKFT